MAVQQLRLHLPMQGVGVQSLVRELRSHMPHSQKKKKTRSNIVTHSIRLLKNGPHQKILQKKKKKKNCIYWNVFWLRVTPGLVNGRDVI